MVDNHVRCLAFVVKTQPEVPFNDPTMPIEANEKFIALAQVQCSAK